MKYSQLLGIAACIGLVLASFVPWSFVAEKNILFTGMNATIADYGKPGLLSIIFCVLMSFCFVYPKIWAKRTNLILAAINLAWALRNYLLISSCHLGECPEKRAGIYTVSFLSVFIMVMTFLPPVKIQQQVTEQ